MLIGNYQSILSYNREVSRKKVWTKSKKDEQLFFVKPSLIISDKFWVSIKQFIEKIYDTEDRQIIQRFYDYYPSCFERLHLINLSALQLCIFQL